MRRPPVSVFFASPLEPEHLDRIQAVSPRLHLLVPSDLWPKARYVADHHGEPRVLSEEQQARWLDMLGRAEICLDFDRRHLERLTRLAPRLKWIQSTSSGVCHYVASSGVDQAGVVVTTAGGVHAVPLAEWTLSAIFWHEKRYPLLAELRAGRKWQRFCGGEACGKTALIVGYGQVGNKVGRYLEAVGVAVYGLDSGGLAAVPAAARTVGGVNGAAMHVPGAGLAAALARHLASGSLAAAALDVFEEEPLPADSPLWDMANVLINPHSASTSHRENGRITDIFCDNLQRYLAGQPLRNVYHPSRGY